MFSKPNKPASPGARIEPLPVMTSDSSAPSAKKTLKVASLVGGDMAIEGGVTGEGELHVDGAVKGDIRVGKLTIGETGHIEGGVYAEVVEVRGRVVGSITAKQVRLYGTCYVDGDITHEQLAMETGAFFQGRSLKFQRPAPTPVAQPAPVGVTLAPVAKAEA